MKIYYVHHSSFIVETKSSFLIFDFFQSKPHKSNHHFNFSDLLNKILNSSKNVYVFASHNHHDHYSSEILSWDKKNQIYFILDNGIRTSAKNNVYYVKENEQLNLYNLKIHTFTSTDEGVSFLVNVDDLNIFHAGDLNWWNWKGDTIEDRDNMESAFKNAIEDIKKSGISVNAAFFPVDGRLEENYNCGGKYFIEQLSPEIFIPMHFWDNFDVVSSFKNSHIKEFKGTKIIGVHHPNEILSI